MIKNLQNPIEKVTTISLYEVAKFIDDPSNRTVVATVYIENVGPKDLILWEGDDYTAIGQWTDSQALARIDEIIINLFS